MFFPLRSNLPTSPFTAAHHASRLALTLMASLLLAACGSSTPTPATPTPLLAPDLSVVNPQPYTQDTDITPLVFANSGGDAASCTIGNPGLPTGLNVRVFADNGKRTCRITGMPTEVVSPARMVTITATNTAGSDTATVSIIVNPATPNLQELGAQSYPTGALVNVALMNTGGGELTECTVNNTLPNGLSVARNTGNDSCEITGTPDTVTLAANYDITATNDGGSDTATVSIAVPSGVASFETATPGALVYAVDDIVSESFTNTNADGSRVSACVAPTDRTLPDELSIDAIASPGNGCVLTGTPTAVTEQASYTITVTNDNGDASLTLDITVNPAAPNLSAVNAQTYTQHTDITPLIFGNTGGDVTNDATGCDVDNSDGNGLPTGLMVRVFADNGKMTCRIFGTPTEVVSPARMVTITATNDGGSDTATVSIIVNPPAVPDLDNASAQTYTQNTDITPLVFDNTGGDVTDDATGCDVDNSGGNDLPLGLMVRVFADNGKRTCRITGMPTEVVSPARMVTITATNTAGSDTATVSITVNPPAVPDLSAVNAQIYAPNTDITPLVFDNAGGDVTDGITGCTVDRSGGKPNLPTGLDVRVFPDNGKRTCQITGMPTELVNPARMVTITATNVTGSDAVTVPITVHSGIVPDSLSGQSLFRYEAGRTAPETRQITFTNTADAITSCTVPNMIDGMPNGLPDGMSINTINTVDCAISGEPLRIMAQTTPHTITATHMGGATSTATISIETYFSAPPSLSDYSGVTLVVGSTVGLPIVLENTGGLVGENGCQVSSDNTGGEQPLSGLDLELAVTTDSGSCEIKAIDTDPADPIPPTATVEGARYSISATNDLGISRTAVVTFTVIGASPPPPAPTLTAPTLNTFTFATNEAIDPINFDLDDGGVIGICTIDQTLPDDQTLPAGLRLNPSTCQITGTPVEAVSPARTITITATNATGSATATVSITVTNAAPALESMAELNLTLSSNAGLPFVIANTGGSPTDCAADPTTDGDDFLDSYNLIIFVADGTCVIDSRDGNGPSRTLDGGSFTITASGTPASAATLTLNLRTPATPQISAGNKRTYAINAARQLFGWGNNEENQLGLGDPGNFPDSTSTPILLAGNDWAQVASGQDYTCAIKASGQLWCWGINTNGQLGLGDFNSRNIPTQVGGDSNWMQVSVAEAHTCAISTSRELSGELSGELSRKLWCWGRNTNGQLGLGHENGAGTPTRVGEDEDWAQVSVSNDHTCAINTSGRLFCWGRGTNSRLGLGDDDDDDDDENTPARVGDAEDWMQVSAGSVHTCTIKTSGQLWCWGQANDGRLGLGDNFLARTPEKVGRAENWTQVSAGSQHTCAINTFRQLWCWGAGSSGRLGLGNDTSTNTPTQVGRAENWMQVKVGRHHTCATNTSGQLFCWGDGEFGRLGLGSDTSTNTPTLVPDFPLQ